MINWDKAVPPTQRLTFLGVDIDTVAMQLALPETKLCELRELLSDTMSKRSITKRDLHSLVGKLNFAARVVFDGRTFLQRMIDTVNNLRRPHHHTRPTAEIKADMSWWAEFLSNGTRFFVDSEPLDVAEFSKDACPLSAGGYVRGDWFYLHWTVHCPTLAKAHINLQETYTVLAALERWKQELSGKWLTMRTDKVNTVSVINKGTSRNPQVMQWLRTIFWLSATHNFRLTARYISSRENTIADARSIAPPGPFSLY